ncbi:unnamed protein product [Ilex paraguariensis]|uniref:Uncharacterized protein n=1 Tax=Ilex paraguariensis TaxID=185542 RepID=A0ABC8RSQ0_9AQUA
MAEGMDKEMDLRDERKAGWDTPKNVDELLEGAEKLSENPSVVVTMAQVEPFVFHSGLINLSHRPHRCLYPGQIGSVASVPCGIFEQEKKLQLSWSKPQCSHWHAAEKICILTNHTKQREIACVAKSKTSKATPYDPSEEIHPTPMKILQLALDPLTMAIDDLIHLF